MIFLAADGGWTPAANFTLVFYFYLVMEKPLDKTIKIPAIIKELKNWKYCRDGRCKITWTIKNLILLERKNLLHLESEKKDNDSNGNWNIEFSFKSKKQKFPYLRKYFGMWVNYYLLDNNKKRILEFDYFVFIYWLEPKQNIYCDT